MFKVYRGAVEFRRAEVLSMERMERIGGTLDALDGTKSTRNLRPLSALKYLGMKKVENLDRKYVKINMIIYEDIWFL